MKNFFFTCILIFVSAGLILTGYSCKNRKDTLLLTTSEISGISQTSAYSGGKISADKNISVILRGVCWGTEENPALSGNKTEDGKGMGNYVSSLRGLKPGVTYYVRAYAIAGSDTTYGNNVSFISQDYGSVTDKEGNIYRTIIIGAQTWMAENLASTMFSDGSAIPLVTGEAAWAGLTKSGYCWYKNDEISFRPEYGALYNWYAVNSGKLCPAGWHVPTDEEWTILTDYLGGETVAGGKMKETGTTFWVDPNTGATNSTAFSAFPGGFRYHDGKFFDFGFSAYWWTSTEYIPGVAWFRFLYYNESTLFRFNNQTRNGFSVRCIKSS